MFPPKKKPAVTVAIGVGKPKPGGMSMGMGGGKPSFGKPKPKPAPSPDDLESPDPAEGHDEPDADDMGGPSDYDADNAVAPDMASMGQGYGAKLEKDIEDVGAALGNVDLSNPAQAKMAAGAFLAAAGRCLMGGGEGDAEASPDGDEMIDTEGSGAPGRYGA